MLFMTADRLPLFFRGVILVLLAFLSAMFRLEERYSFLSFMVVALAGLAAGAVLANNSVQVWVFTFLYVVVFFLSCEVFERKILGI